MNYSQIAILFTQGALVALVMLLLFHFRKQLGIGVMFACLGLFQFVQVSLYSAVSVSITDDFLVSPSSAVYFTATLFVLLLVYIKDDTTETKKTIYALFIVNAVMLVLLETLNWHFNNLSTEAHIKLPPRLFNVNSWGLFVSTITLFIDTFLIIILFEYISKKVRFLFWQICLTMLVVISFDTLFFISIVFWGNENLESLVKSGLISKGVFTVFYSVFLYSYLRFFNKSAPSTSVFKIKDVFKPLTYKQKFESAEKEVKDTAEMYRILTDYSRDLIFLQEPDSSFRYISPAIKKLLGYEQSEFIGKFIFSIVHKDDVQTLKDTLHKKLFSKGIATEPIPFRVRHKDGHYIWLEFLSSAVYTGKEISYFVSTARDITQRVLAKKKLETSLELLEIKEHSLSESSKIAKIGYQEYNIDTDTYVWSDYVYDIYGLDPKDGVPSIKDIISIFDKESVTKLNKAITLLNTQGIACDIELRCINLKKEEVWVRYVAETVYNEHKNIIGRKGVLQNITEWKNAQLALEQSKQNIQTSLNLLEKKDYSLSQSSKMAKIGYWEYDIATDTYVWSDYVYRIYGLDPKDEIPTQEATAKILDKESLQKVQQAVLDITTKGTPCDIELKCNLEKGVVWVRYVAEAVYNEQNEIIGRRGVLQNITDWKNAQLELESSKTKIQNSLNLLEKRDFALKESSRIAKIGYWEYDIATDTFTWSDYVYEVYGFNLKDSIPSRKEMVGFYDKESQEKLAQATLDLDLKGIPYDIELKLINNKKEEVWVRNVVQLIYNEQNEIIGRRGVVHNITASKNAQLELELSKNNIQTSLELLERRKYSMDEASKVAKIGYWEHDTIKGTVVWSEYVHRLFGSNPEKGIPAQEAIIETFTKESQEKLAKATLNLTLKGVSYDIELKCINLKGEQIWVRNVAQAIYNEQNEIVGKRGVLHNITASKKAQLELELSKEKIETTLKLLEKKEYSLRKASEIAKIGYQEYVNETGVFTWSDYVYDILRFDIKQGIPSRDEVLAIFDDESKKIYTQATLELIENGTPFDLELKFITKNNEEVWVRNAVQPDYNNENEIIGRRGVLQDITASKKAQFELEESKKNIQNSLDLLEKRKYAMDEASKIAKIGYHEYDIATDTFHWSEYLYHMFGLDIEQPVPRREEILTFFDNASKKLMKQATLDLDLKGTPYDLELKIINRRNEEVWVRNATQPIFNQQNEIIGRRGITQDITASKKAQFDLELSKQNIETSLELLEKSNYSKDEASKTAKIGYLEDDIATETYVWSDYLYHIFGFDPKYPVPPRKEIAALFDIESQNKMQKATLDLDLRGIPYDIELKMINLRKEEIWARIKVEPVYNQQNKIVARRGVFQDITDSKKGQLELELSKQKIETSLELLELSEKSKNEISKVAKIGYLEYDNATDTFLWSDYLYYIFGLDSKNSVPGLKDVMQFLDEESKKKMKRATINLEKNGIPYDIEIKLNNLRNEEVWGRMVVQPIFNKQKQVIGRRGVFQDITASKKDQFALELSKQEIQTSLELLEKSEFSKNEASKMAKIGYWEYDIETKAFIWSDDIYLMYGLDPKKGIPSQEKIVSFYDKESQKKIEETIKDVSLKGLFCDIELKFINEKNEEVWERSVVQPVYNSQNKIVGRRGVMQDITEQKIKQKTLDQQSKELYELNNALNQAQKLSHVGNWSWNMKTDKAEWSDEMYNIFGETKENFYPSNENVNRKILPEDLYKMEQGINSLLIDEVFVPFEFRIKWISGEIRTLYIVALENKNESGVFGVTMDITESKKREEENFRIKANYRKLFDNATISIWNEDFTQVFKQIEELRKREIPNFKIYLEQHPEVTYSLLDKLIINSVNEATLKLYKANNYKEFLVRFQDTFGLGAEEVFKNLIEAIWNHEKTFTSEVNYKTLEGDEFAAILSIPIPQTLAEQKTVPASIQSIQSLKEAELEKKESINRLKEAQALAQVGDWTFDLATEKSKWSNETFRILGFDYRNPVPDRDVFLNRIHREDQPYFNNAADLVLTKGIPYDIEFRICLPGNEEKIIRAICKPIFGDNGEVISLKGTNQDITIKKRIEQNNFIISEKYRNLFDNATVSIWNGDLSEIFKLLAKLRKLKIPNLKIYLEQHPEVLFSILDKIIINKVNKATLELFKAESEKEFLERKIQNTFGKGAHKVFADFIVSIWHNEKTFTSEVNYKTLKGNEFAAIISIPIPQTKIEYKNVPLSIHSIQSIKDAEYAKDESLKKLKEAQKLAKMGSWLFNPSSLELEWSEETFDIYGMDPKEGVPDLFNEPKIIHKEDLEMMFKSIPLGEAFDIEHKITLRNGEQKWIRCISKPKYGETGELISFTGTNQDITEQKRIRIEIEKAEEMYRVLTDNSNDLITLHEPDSTFTYISPSIKNLLGYEQQELLGEKVFGIVHKDDVESLINVMEERVISGVFTTPFTCRVLHKKGHFIWLEFLTSPVYKEQEISHFVSSARDITQWVLAKQEIEEYQSSLQELTTEMTLIEEKQKKEIASNIHDHLSQSLVISKMKINELKKRPQLQLIGEDLSFIESHISEALENSRKITYELSPPVLYQLGIVDALNWLFDNAETTHKITCVVNSNVDSLELNEVKSILLFRSIQEVLTNAIKYAKASLITLEIDKNKRGIDIFITDNGVGFDTSILNSLYNSSSSGFGLFTVKERIRNIQGKFAINSKINVGTTVKIFIPLSK
ncbi:PAS domain-containing protein [Polaribacter sp. Z014]|uniref:PAS domain-containing protein n=1 Tax=Polaribacter sp. Z014 TaxID=2927126 RepID=UPI00201FD8ED|nr:PAS domain-containing protein [Polaribacter sp. Z014]MCL7762239.1 PAS domain-containing protein [Polaribacter sp. Z014]